MEAAKQKNRIDATFLTPFISGTVEVLSMQAGLKVEKEKPFAKPKGHKADIGIAGVITIDCAQFRGTVAICFPKTCFLKIYESMLGESHEEIVPEVQDGAAEILNMVYGQAKTVLKQKGYELEKAIPTVLVGEKLQVHFLGEDTAVIVPFKTDYGTFHLEIIMN